uniref:Uncharacterized protein n=1 Tax=Rousettus aegyptiacus TaxID=9407 RepID=A0A7J8BRS4_ROUAE|nr:hypothetical protein HJG63_009613 [Rousettus aegyptiacus]
MFLLFFFFPLLLVFQLCPCYTFCSCLSDLGYSGFFSSQSLFSFCFLRILMIYLLKDSFSAVSNLFRAHQWCYLCIEFFFFISGISSFCFCFSLGFSFLFLYRPSVLAWCLIYSLESLAFFKNFLSDYSNIPAMSVSDACSGSSNCVFGLWVCHVMCSSQLDIMCQIKETMVNRPSVLSC